MYGLNKTIDEYKKYGVDVFLVSQVPQQMIEPVRAYQRAYKSDDDIKNDVLRELSVSLDEHKRLNAYVSSVINVNPYIKILNFDKLLCDAQYCPVGTKTTSYYFDDDHLSIVGAGRLIPSIEQLLSQSVK